MYRHMLIPAYKQDVLLLFKGLELGLYQLLMVEKNVKMNLYNSERVSFNVASRIVDNKFYWYFVSLE
jgi:hypothetical protein